MVLQIVPRCFEDAYMTPSKELKFENRTSKFATIKYRTTQSNKSKIKSVMNVGQDLRLVLIIGIWVI